MTHVLNRRLLLFMLVLFCVVGCGGIDSDPVSPTAEAALREARIRDVAPEGTRVELLQDRAHNSDIEIAFGSLPPMGGMHNPQWQRCQVYDKPVATKHALHTMEHGAVWVTYQPDLAADAVERLEAYATNEPFVLMSPFPNLRSPVVLTAWGLQLEVDSAEDPRIQQFIDAFAGGEQSPEPGASCTTGVTDTVDG